MSEQTNPGRFARNSIVIASLTLVAAFAAYLAYRESDPARGYTALGVAYGILSTLLFAFAMAYSWRKRSGQERLPGKLETWLWLHWVLSVLAIGIALLHSGFNVNGRSGTWTLLVTCALVASGIVGWFLYRKVPLDVAATTGNLAVTATEKELQDIAQKIAEAAAGRSQRFKEYAADVRAGRSPGDLSDIEATEMTALSELEDSLRRQRDLEGRLSKQRKLRTRMRGWLWIHVPTSLLILVLLPYHAYDALDFRFNLFEPAPNDFASPETCAQCHPRQYREWIGSMHAIAQLSPVTDLQTRLVLAKEREDELAGVPHTVVGDLCERCHAPTGTVASDPSEHENPLKEVTARAPASRFGVSCVACHQIVSIKERTDNPDFPLRNAGGLLWHAGRTYVGPFGAGTSGDPKSTGNSFHRGIYGAHIGDPRLCRSCHTVTVDDPVTGAVRFPLQNTWAEWEDRNNKNFIKWGPNSGSSGTPCVGCHSRDLSAAVAKIAEMQDEHLSLKDRQESIQRIIGDVSVPDSYTAAAASIERFDNVLPAREQYSHTFTGVDYHLEDDLPFPASNASSGENATIQHETVCRVEQLLKLAAAIRIEDWPKGPQLRVDVMNLATGHNFPAGFAFAREAWLEVAVSLLQRGNDWKVIVGGAGPEPLPATMDLDTRDPGLHNFQAVLFDENADQPTVLQNETTGVLKVSKDLVAHGFASREQFLLAGEIRNITVALPNAIDESVLRVRVRLRFRNYPPEFLRGLGARFKEDAARAGRANALVDRLRIFEVSQDVIGRGFDAPPERRDTEFGCAH